MQAVGAHPVVRPGDAEQVAVLSSTPLRVNFVSHQSGQIQQRSGQGLSSPFGMGSKAQTRNQQKPLKVEPGQAPLRHLAAPSGVRLRGRWAGHLPSLKAARRYALILYSGPMLSPTEVAIRTALQSVLVAGIVLALKFAACAATGSVALLSDAIESIINVVAAGAAFVALRIRGATRRRRPPLRAPPRPSTSPPCLEGVLIVARRPAGSCGNPFTRGPSLRAEGHRGPRTRGCRERSGDRDQRRPGARRCCAGAGAGARRRSSPTAGT